MKKLWYSAMLLLTSFAGLAQTSEKGDIKVSVGYGIGIWAIESEQNNSGVITRDESAAAASIIPIYASYTLHPRLSVGLFFNRAKYLQDDSSKVSKDVHAVSNPIGLNLNLHITPNAKRSDLHWGFDFAPDGLRYTETSKTTGDKAFTLHKGIYIANRLTWNIYFTENAGMFLSAGYSYHKFDFKRAELNGEEIVWVGVYDFDSTFKGLELKFGLAAKF